MDKGEREGRKEKGMRVALQCCSVILSQLSREKYNRPIIVNTPLELYLNARIFLMLLICTRYFLGSNCSLCTSLALKLATTLDVEKGISGEKY